VAYSPTIEDMADIVRRWRANLAATYPPQPTPQVQLPDVAVRPDPMAPLVMPSGATITPSHDITQDQPLAVPGPPVGASAEMGFPTIPGSLSPKAAFIRAPGGFRSGIPTPGAPTPPSLSGAVVPDAGTPSPGYDPALGRTADLSLPPGFLQDYQRTKNTNNALAASMIMNGGLGFPGAPTLSSAFANIQPQDMPADLSYSRSRMVGGPLPISRPL